MFTGTLLRAIPNIYSTVATMLSQESRRALTEDPTLLRYHNDLDSSRITSIIDDIAAQFVKSHASHKSALKERDRTIRQLREELERAQATHSSQSEKVHQFREKIGECRRRHEQRLEAMRELALDSKLASPANRRLSTHKTDKGTDDLELEIGSC
jgi:chromosome segregation ATPase